MDPKKWKAIALQALAQYKQRATADTASYIDKLRAVSGPPSEDALLSRRDALMAEHYPSPAPVQGPVDRGSEASQLRELDQIQRGFGGVVKDVNMQLRPIPMYRAAEFSSSSPFNVYRGRK